MWNAISLVQIWTRVAVSISYDDNHYTTGNYITIPQEPKLEKKVDVETEKVDIILTNIIRGDINEANELVHEREWQSHKL